MSNRIDFKSRATLCDTTGSYRAMATRSELYKDSNRHCEHDCVDVIYNKRYENYACPWHKLDGTDKDMTLPRHLRDL